MKKNNELMELLAKHAEDMARFNGCQETKRLTQEKIEDFRKETREHLAKAQEALTKPGDALENGREATARKEAAGITEARRTAAEAELMALPEGDRSSIRYELQGALRVKFAELRESCKNEFSSTFKKCGVSMPESLWSAIWTEVSKSNDSFVELYRRSQDADVYGPYTVEAAERGIQALEAKFE